MKIIKIILILLVVISAPMAMLSFTNYATEEVEMNVCTDRRYNYCRGERCKDLKCRYYEWKRVRLDRTLFNAIKSHPIILVTIILYFASLVTYMIALKRNAYCYIGVEDMGTSGLIAFIIYMINAFLVLLLPISLYTQVGIGPIITWIMMLVVPFIIRPIMVDW